MAELLATFIQISDLHFGEIDPTNGDATLSMAIIRLTSTFPQLDGLLGHHARGLDDLAKFCAENRPNVGEFRVIITGDLTRCGSQTEIQLAYQYLFDRIDIQPPNKNMVGLQLAPREVIGIPGNHDHWGGSLQPIGGTPSHYTPPNGSQVTPYSKSVTLRNGRVVRFVGIDSDADVWPYGWKRMLAWGSFRNQLTKAGAQLGANTKDEIRMCLVHHSFSKRGKTLRMDGASRTQFERYLIAHGFKAMLSGHTHVFLLPSQHGQMGLPFEELRCGSTTQHDVVPYNWVTLTGKAPTRKWLRNTLLVHSIYGAPGLTTWETQAFGRFDDGFQTLGHAHWFHMTV